MSRRSRMRDLSIRLSAELGVVVLGVWIALWADGWVADRNERRIEATRLQALQQNIAQSLQTLRQEIEEVEGAVAALRGLVSLPDPGADADEVEDLLLYGFFYVPGFSPKLNVYDDLKNSGELGLLTDPELRQALSSMEATLAEASLAQQDVSTVQQLNFDSYLLARVDLRSVLGRHLDLPPAGELSKPDLHFTTSREFRNLALFKLDLLDQVQGVFRQAEEDLVRVERLITTVGMGQRGLSSVV